MKKGNNMNEELCGNIVSQIGARIDDALKFFDSISKIQTERQDAHGQQMREGFSKLFSKLDENQKEMRQKIENLDNRVTILEVQRKSFGELFTKTLSFLGGASGIAALIERLRHP